MSYTACFRRLALLFVFPLMVLLPGVRAQTPANGDLLAEIVSTKNNLPAAASEGFVIPMGAEETQWRTLINTLLDGDVAAANAQVLTNFPSYELFEYTDTGLGNEVYYLLRETFPVVKGWGSYVFNLNYLRDLAIEVPHPIHDTNTHTQGIDVFRRTGARLFLMAGTHRCANAALGCIGSSSACGDGVFHRSDMAHSDPTPFQAVHEELVDREPQTYTFNLHGNSNGSCLKDIFLSNGHATDSKQILTDLRTSIINAGGLTVAIAGDGTDTCPFFGTTNTQGRYSNGSANICTMSAGSTTGFFIHVEQKRPVRDNFSEYIKLIDAINDNIDLLLPVTLTALEATAVGRTVQLKWTTASEQQNAGFEVQQTAAEGEWVCLGDRHDEHPPDLSV